MSALATRGRGFVADHWHGRHSPILSVMGTLVGLRLVLIGALGASATALGAAIWAVLAADLVVMFWQVVGTGRSLRRHLAGSSEQIAMWGGYAAILVVTSFFAIRLLDVISVGLGQTPEDYVGEAVVSVAATAAALRIEDGVAFVEGDIGFVQNTALREALAAGAPIRTVSLTSDGGNVFAARALVMAVLENGIATHVPDHCRSACVLVFLAGKTRSLAEGAVLGFHGYSVAQNTPIIDVEAQMARDRALYAARGVDPGFAERAFAVPASDIWEPSRAELRTAGVLTD